jgi:hypothetical protein
MTIITLDDLDASLAWLNVAGGMSSPKKITSGFKSPPQGQ